MAAQTLRPYQMDGVHAYYDSRDMEYTRVILTMATGLGKTSLASEIIRLEILFNPEARVLFLAHRRELIMQAYDRIKEHCELSMYEIGIELNVTRASSGSKVVVGSIQTVMSADRLQGWKPTLIIVDECHRAGSKSYRDVFARYGVPEKRCRLLGITATPKRGDKQSLYAIGRGGERVELLDKKKNVKFFAKPEDSIFEYHCYDVNTLDGINEGWLAPIIGHTVKSETDISGVETDIDGDFKDGQIADAVDNNERTLLAIAAWKQCATMEKEGVRVCRPTLAFCAGVEHAYHSAALWEQAGFRAAALDGSTEGSLRGQVIKDFRAGRIDVLCNCALFTEGTDLPTCACIVHLRPTTSWNIYVQSTGRGTRTLPGVIDGIADAEGRKRAIAASAKPNCLVLDVVDICKGKTPCSVPSILDLPVNLDLQGQSLTQAKKLLDEFDEVKALVIGECPTTYRELQVRLAQVDILTGSNARTQADWRASEDGFRFQNVRREYNVKLSPEEDGKFRLRITRNGEEVYNKRGKPFESFREYLDTAAEAANIFIEKQGKGTVDKLSKMGTGGYLRVLRRNGHSNAQIDRMETKEAVNKAKQYLVAYQARMAKQESYPSQRETADY